jgi:16S rRNA processing protein RimM
MGDAAAVVEVGRVVRPWGREGAVLVEPWTHDPGRFGRLDRVALVPGEDRRILRSRTHGDGRVLLWLEGVDSIDAAEGLRGRRLVIPAELAERPAGPAYLHAELVGASVWTEDGKELGTVRSILETGGTDVLQVAGSHGEYLIPLAAAILVGVDVAAGRITVRPVPGLLELNRGDGDAV